MSDNNGLSERELEILRLVATGASNKEIAQKLYISTNTVKVHLRNIFAKIGVISRTEAAMYAVHIGLVKATPIPERITPEGALPQRRVVAKGLLPVYRLIDAIVSVPRHRRIWIGGGFMFLLLVMVVGLGLLVFGLFPNQGGSASNLSSVPTDPPRWQVKAAMPSGRYGMAAATYEEQIYLIGGETGKGVVSLNEYYDPKTDRWSSLTPKPIAVSDVQAAMIGGKIYIPGGRLASGAVTDVLEIYIPRQDKWERGARLPVAVSAYALAAFEGKLYLFGGWDGVKYLNSVYEYDPDHDSWNKRTSMPTARGFMSAAIAMDKIFVLGGYDGKNALVVNEVYLPERDEGGENPWDSAASMPDRRYAMGAASVANVIDLIGGSGGRNTTPNLMEYLPQADVWRVFEISQGQYGYQTRVVALSPNIYALGGLVKGVPSTQNLAYQVVYNVLFPVVK